MLNRIVIIVVLAIIVVTGGTSGARAQQPISSGLQAPGPSGLTFDIAPYLWFASVRSKYSFDLPADLGGTV
jgi:hypothetical protein